MEPGRPALHGDRLRRRIGGKGDDGGRGEHGAQACRDESPEPHECPSRHLRRSSARRVPRADHRVGGIQADGSVQSTYCVPAARVRNVGSVIAGVVVSNAYTHTPDRTASRARKDGPGLVAS
jgi:hypothetical protein